MQAAMRDRAARPMSLATRPSEDHARVAVCALSGGAAGPTCGHVVHEWVPRGMSIEPCHVHDPSRPGLERWDGFWLPWAKQAGRPLSPDAGSLRAEGRAEAPRIDYPHDGARFVFDVGRAASLQTVSVRVSGGGASAELLVDGSRLAPVHAGVARWQLARGEHVLVALSGASMSAPVRVHVD
jgi:hypothetical protein